MTFKFLFWSDTNIRNKYERKAIIRKDSGKAISKASTVPQRRHKRATDKERLSGFSPSGSSLRRLIPASCGRITSPPMSTPGARERDRLAGQGQTVGGASETRWHCLLCLQVVRVVDVDGTTVHGYNTVHVLVLPRDLRWGGVREEGTMGGAKSPPSSQLHSLPFTVARCFSFSRRRSSHPASMADYSSQKVMSGKKKRRTRTRCVPEVILPPREWGG